MRRSPLLLVLPLAAVLAGCTATDQNASAGNFKGAERDVAEVLDDLKASRDPEEICSRLFTDALAKSLEADGQDCVDEVQATIRDTANTDLDVRDVSIEGPKARAEVSQDGENATFELERGADGWQISSLGAQPS